MHPKHSAILVAGIALSSPVLSSCNRGEPQAEPTMTEEQAASSAMPTAGSSMPMAASAIPPQMRAGCPMVVPGATVAVSDVKDGVALDFTAAQGSTADLRTRVQHLAQMYRMHSGQGGMMWRYMGHRGMGPGGPHMGPGGPHMGRHYGPMPAVSASVADTDRGARLELKPTDPSQLDSLRQRVRDQSQRMQSGGCWRWQSQLPAASASPSGGQ